VLSAGEMELLKAFADRRRGALAWYGARCWLASRDRRTEPHDQLW
jgi:hypothetical protein